MKPAHMIVLLSTGGSLLIAGALAAVTLPHLGWTSPPHSAAGMGTLPTIQRRHDLEDLKALKAGMTYDMAARTLGTPGHEAVPRTAQPLGLDPQLPVDVYAWPNPDGSRIVLVFEQDRLTLKGLLEPQ